MDQEFADVKLAVVVDRGFVIGTIGGCITQNVVDVLMFGGIAFESKLKEGRIEIKGILQLAGLRTLHQFFDIS
jgi:hypothetical protein